MELKTPLYGAHVKAGGKIVPFAGYLLPVQYGTGVITEHMAVREKAGLFDVSHMGQIKCSVFSRYHAQVDGQGQSGVPRENPRERRALPPAHAGKTDAHLPGGRWHYR